MASITWQEIIDFAQVCFTFLTAIVAFVSIGFNRNMKSVDVSLGCQARHAAVMEKLYSLYYGRINDQTPHPGIAAAGLISQSELSALFNLYWHLVHDEYQYWRDKHITNEMFFRWIDGIFDELRSNYIYYCRGLHNKEGRHTYRELWENVRDQWFRNRSFGRFMAEVVRQADTDIPTLDARPLMHFKKRRYRRVR